MKPAVPAQLPERRLHQRLLDLVFPPRCVECARPGAWICVRCWPQVQWLALGHCSQCDEPLSSSKLCAACLRRAGTSTAAPPVNIRAVARFEGIARKAVHELKYNQHFDIATVLGPLMASRVTDCHGQVLVPVPLHWRRKRARGYNQAELLARQMGRLLGISVEARALRRHRDTHDQIALDASRRRKNVAEAFRWVGALPQGPVLLVDDVYTTGATMNASAAAFRAAGGKEVEGIVFACAPQVAVTQIREPSDPRVVNPAHESGMTQDPD